MATMTLHLRTNLRGIRKNFWRKNMSGWFSIDGQILTDAEARKMIEYALEKGVVYDSELDADEIRKVLGWDN